MPYQENIFNIFVASPSDVSMERDKLEEVIHVLNKTWSRKLGVRLNLIRWETDTYPAIGDDAQSIINDQIPDDYDLFIGIMWGRFGTPTKRAESGTIEEFQRAKARYDKDPSTIQIMFYFKDEPISPSELDPEQLRAIQTFRKSLGEEGALYNTFNSLKDFEQYITMHLSRYIQEWEQKTQTINQPKRIRKDLNESVAVATLTDDFNDDLGILDYLDMLFDRFEEAGKLMGDIGVFTTELTEKITARTEELTSLPKDSQGNLNRKDARRIMVRTAGDMNQFTEKVNLSTPLFSKSFNQGMDAFVQYIQLSTELDSDQDYNSTVATISELLGVFEASIFQFGNFQDTINVLPKMVKEFNKAKRSSSSALGELIDEMSASQSVLQEAQRTIKRLQNSKGNLLPI